MGNINTEIVGYQMTKIPPTEQMIQLVNMWNDFENKIWQLDTVNHLKHLKTFENIIRYAYKRASRIKVAFY
jgi:hypothetical protein